VQQRQTLYRPQHHLILRHDACEVCCTRGPGSLSLRERAGGEGLCSLARPLEAPHPLPPGEGKESIHHNHRAKVLVAMCLLLVCVGALGVTAAGAQTVTPRLGTSPFASGDPPGETAQQLYNGADVQRRLGFDSNSNFDFTGDSRLLMEADFA
jgi:hypothetical protein